MNRRLFLRQSSAAALLAAGLPAAVRRGLAPAYTYRTSLDSSKAGQWFYEIKLFHEGVDGFDTATDEQKVIALKVGWFETTDFTAPTKQGEYRYLITKAGKKKDEEFFVIQTKLDAKVSGDHEFPKEYSKNLVFQCSEYEYIKILNKKKNAGAELAYYTEPAAGSGGTGTGCFLTTACLVYRGLPDDCEELQTLRHLRNDFMTQTEEGLELISDYRQHAPALVEAIDGCENKDEIYGYMYRKMIRPTVGLVKAGRYQEAVQYYREFSDALYTKYITLH